MYEEANIALDIMEMLGENWNKNHAAPFSKSLIEKCRQILTTLPKEPFVVPTSDGAIQMEYE